MLKKTSLAVRLGDKRIRFCPRFNCATEFSLSFPLVPLPFPLPPFSSSCSPLRPCWIGGVNTGREWALFQHARAEAWAFLQCRCAGVKSLPWFSFHLSSANHDATAAAPELWPLQRIPLERWSVASFTTRGPSHLPFPRYSFSSLLTVRFHVLTEPRWNRIHNRVMRGNGEQQLKNCCCACW